MSLANLTADLRVPRGGTLKAHAIERLRNAILSTRLRPGERLIERELCDALGVSRAVVREVVTTLEAEGLVQVVPHRGPRVALYSPAEAMEIYELRATLEEMSGRLFTQRANDLQVENLGREVEKIRAAFETGSAIDWLAAKTGFYEVLLEGTGNTFLTDTVRRMHGRVTMLRATTMSQPDRLAKSLREITAIVDAIRRRDAAAAAAACRDHVESAARVAIGMLSRDETNIVPA